MPLSVLSARARLDLDPWKEAAELSELPSDRATQRFAEADLLGWLFLHRKMLICCVGGHRPYQCSKLRPVVGRRYGQVSHD